MILTASAFSNARAIWFSCDTRKQPFRIDTILNPVRLWNTDEVNIRCFYVTHGHYSGD